MNRTLANNYGFVNYIIAFDAEIVTDAPVAVAAASMKAVRCPKCGSDKCELGGNNKDAPPVTASIADRVWWWGDRGERGTSSNTIFAAMGGSSLSKLMIATCAEIQKAIMENDRPS